MKTTHSAIAFLALSQLLAVAGCVVQTDSDSDRVLDEDVRADVDGVCANPVTPEDPDKAPDGYVPVPGYDLGSRIVPNGGTEAFRDALHCVRQLAADTYEPPENGADNADKNPNRCQLQFLPEVTKAIPNVRFYKDPNLNAATGEYGLVRTVAIAIRGTASWADWGCNANSQFTAPVTHTNVFSSLQAGLPTYTEVGTGWDARMTDYFITKKFPSNPGSATLIDLRQRVLEQVALAKLTKQELRVIVTGHSQGGAIASLAALDLAHYLSKQPIKQSVWAVTFNAAQVGQHNTDPGIVHQLRKAFKQWDSGLTNPCPHEGKVCIRLNQFDHGGDIVHQVPQNASMSWDQPVWNKNQGWPNGTIIDTDQPTSAHLQYCPMFWWEKAPISPKEEYLHPHHLNLWTKGIDGISDSHINCMRSSSWSRWANSLSGRITIRAGIDNQFVSADNAGASPLIPNRNAAGSWEEFDVTVNADGTVSFRAVANNRWVTAENAGASSLIANRVSIGDWEKFTSIKNSDGTFSLKAKANGKFVTAENAGVSPLIANKSVIGTWEKFWIAGAP